MPNIATMKREKVPVDYGLMTQRIADKKFTLAYVSTELGYNSYWFNDRKKSNSLWDMQTLKFFALLVGGTAEDYILKETIIPMTKPSATLPVVDSSLVKAIENLTHEIEALNNRVTTISNRTIETKKQQEIMIHSLDQIDLGMQVLKEAIDNIPQEDTFSKTKAKIVYLFHNTTEIEEQYLLARMKEWKVDNETFKLACEDLGLRIVTKHNGAKSIKRYYSLPYGKE